MARLMSELLHGLSPEEAAALTGLGTVVQVPAGHVLFQIGDPADGIFVVQSGRVSLTVPLTVRGVEEHVLIEERLPGETLGWSGLVPPHRFTLKATAATETGLLGFARGVLMDHFEENPKVGRIVTHNLASVIGRRLAIFQTMWLREMQRTVEQRFS
jgi:CRP-like cAMP-binding protein